ncbi:MAG: DoxX family protein [Chitinophagaceae bacterium]
MNKFLSPLPYMQQEGLAIIRIIVGLLMVFHGFEIFDTETMQGYTTWAQFKEMPSPAVIVYAGKGAELVTGILFVIGWFTRPAALLLIITMLYISFFVGHGKVWYDDQHPFLFVLLGGVFFFTGPGKWSVDELSFKKNK